MGCDSRSLSMRPPVWQPSFKNTGAALMTWTNSRLPKRWKRPNLLTLSVDAHTSEDDALCVVDASSQIMTRYCIIIGVKEWGEGKMGRLTLLQVESWVRWFLFYAGSVDYIILRIRNSRDSKRIAYNLNESIRDGKWNRQLVNGHSENGKWARLITSWRRKGNTSYFHWNYRFSQSIEQ